MIFLLPLFFVFFTPCVRADDVSMLEMGKQHFQTKHYYFATTWLERLLNNYHASPHRREALIIISKAYVLSGRDEKAAHYLGILRSEFPDAEASMEPEYRKLAESVPTPKSAPPAPSVPIEPLPSPSGTKIDAAPQTAKPAVAVSKPVPTSPSRDSVSTLPLLEKVTVDRVKPGLVAQADVGNISRPVSSAPLPISIPKVAPVAKPVFAPAVPAPATASKTAPTAATSSPSRAPSADGNVPEQKHVFYTLSAGETVNYSKLGSLIKKLKASGLQPVVRKEIKTMDVFRLVTECFRAKSAAQKRLTQLARKEKHAFIVHDAKQSCVVAASFFSNDAALTGQNMLAKKSIRTEIVKASVPLTTWQVTIGRYNDSQSAAAEMKRLAERGIHVVVVVQDR
jgi:hypothetical protein